MKKHYEDQQVVIFLKVIFIVIVVIVVIAILIKSGPSDAKNVREQEAELKYEPLDFKASIIDKLNDVEDKEFQRNMFYYLTNYVHDETKLKVIRQYLKANPNEKLIKEAFSKLGTPILIYASKLESNAFKTIVFGNLGLLNNPDGYLKDYVAKYYASVDKVIVRDHPELVVGIRDYIANNYQNEEMLRKGISFLKANELINLNFAEDIIESFNDKSNKLELSSKISRIKRRLSDIKDLLKEETDEYNKILTIRGYMVADIKNDSYEIRVNGAPAVLHTDINIYKSKGWFTTNVIRNGSTSVQLKEEYGNFNQSWPVYEEVSQDSKDEQLQEIYNLKNKVKDLRNEMESVQTKLNNVKARLESFSKKYPNPIKLIRGDKQS